jgi:hypothetical protein
LILSTYFPNYELVVILAAERRQVLFIVGERETLNQNLVHFQPVHHLESIEVPDDDVRLTKSSERKSSDLNYFPLPLSLRANSRTVTGDLRNLTYLEALPGLLSTCNVLSGVGSNDNGDLVVVATEELLCSADDVSDNNRGAQREDQVLIIRVQNESLVHLACKEGVSETTAQPPYAFCTYP